MSAAAILPWIYAVAQPPCQPTPAPRQRRRPVQPQVAFYRKYTEAMLRRYVCMSMEAGKVPSLLGQEMFRGKVTNYRVGGFDDVVIFLHDVERCMEKLEETQQVILARIALQQYTVNETAEATGLDPRTIVRRYHRALDSLTRIFLIVHMLQPQKCCQGVDY